MGASNFVEVKRKQAIDVTVTGHLPFQSDRYICLQFLNLGLCDLLRRRPHFGPGSFGLCASIYHKAPGYELAASTLRGKPVSVHGSSFGNCLNQ